MPPQRTAAVAAAVCLFLAGCGPATGDTAGHALYRVQCASCHQANGAGIGDAYPPVVGTDWVSGDPYRLVRLVLYGVRGPMDVNGRRYDNLMPPYDFLDDDEVAALTSYLRGLSGAPPIDAALVAAVRAQGRPPGGLWNAADLRDRVGPAPPVDETDAERPEASEAEPPGAAVYVARCLACHQADGRGVPGQFPPLVGTDWVSGDVERLIRLVLAGLSGPLEIDGVTYNNVMPPHAFLTDEELADVITYVRDRFGDGASAVTPSDVAAVRAATSRTRPWTVEELAR